MTGFDVAGEKLTQDFIDAAHKAGLLVSVYPVLSPEKMRHFISVGVDAIETDVPGELRKLLPK